MGVETSEPGLVESENSDQAEKIRQLTEAINKLEREDGPVLEAVRDYANRAGGMVNETRAMRLHVFTDVRQKMRELLDNQPDKTALDQIEAALEILNNETVTPAEMGDIITESGAPAAEKLANRISLAREQQMKAALGLTDAAPNPES